MVLQNPLAEQQVGCTVAEAAGIQSLELPDLGRWADSLHQQQVGEMAIVRASGWISDNCLFFSFQYIPSNLTSWPNQGDLWLQTRSGQFDSEGVEAGPPPLPLSDGNYLFFYNSWNSSGAYHPAFVILDGQNPGNILQRATEPLLTPDGLPWAMGVSPYTCNVDNVVFLEAAYSVGPDIFRVYFGGSDATIGTALFKVSISP